MPLWKCSLPLTLKLTSIQPELQSSWQLQTFRQRWQSLRSFLGWSGGQEQRLTKANKYGILYSDIQIYGRSILRELVKAFKALSDETRIRLLKLLQQRELCVCELMQALDMTQSRVSRNLGILKDAGLVKDRRDGLWVHYSLDEKSFSKYAGPLLELLKDWSNDNEIIRRDLEGLSKAVRLSETGDPDVVC
ncbi:ArsR/SmtB family transcription factor [Candidatus Poribacteria bacterium]